LTNSLIQNLDAHKLISIGFTDREILLSLDRAIVLALCIVQHHAHPLAGRKQGAADERHNTPDIFAGHFHPLADLHGRHFGGELPNKAKCQNIFLWDMLVDRFF